MFLFFITKSDIGEQVRDMIFIRLEMSAGHTHQVNFLTCRDISDIGEQVRDMIFIRLEMSASHTHQVNFLTHRDISDMGSKCEI